MYFPIQTTVKLNALNIMTALLLYPYAHKLLLPSTTRSIS